MKYIIVPENDKERLLPFYFAVEEYVAHTYTDDDYFFMWQVPPTVMLGRNQLLENEIDIDYCHKNNIHVFRRKSGGGCIYADGGCLLMSYIVADRDVNRVFATYMQSTINSLRKAGVNATLSGRNDIIVEGRKVGGAAFYRTGQRSVMHNSLLFNTDLSILDHAVQPPHEKLLSKGVSSVSQRVGNVADFTQMTLSDFIALARDMHCAKQYRILNSDDMEAIAKIEQQLSSDEFIYGNNPQYTIQRKRHIGGVGYVEAYVDVKNNEIKHINLMGDYFLLGDIDRDLLSHLHDCTFSREAVEQALQGVDTDTIVRGLTTDAFIRLLFGPRPHVMKPEWLRIARHHNEQYDETESIIKEQRLYTICQSGLCPNRAECWRNGAATLMIAGDICTRHCRFCNTKSGRPLPLDPDEPQRVADSIRQMKLRYAVITSVDRDDLPDLGATHWAETINQIRQASPQTGIEVLIPDFQGQHDLIDIVLSAKPDVVGHNMETTRRLTPSVRSVARYEQSLDVLHYIEQQGFTSKTGFMVGLGETESEVAELMDDIRATGCRLMTIGQYLQPSAKHLPVIEYIHPDQFHHYREMALERGFTHVESGPLVRSSYHAERILDNKQQ